MTGAHQVLAALADVEIDVRRAVAERKAVDPKPDDPYRGLYLTPEMVDRILADGPAAGDGPSGPVLTRLAENFELTDLDVRFLLVALAPEIDPRFERLYAYLNDDVTRGRATVGLVLSLCGLPPAGAGRFRFGSGAPLVSGGLIEVLDEDRPALARALRLPDRVVAHLLGDRELDPSIAGACRVRTENADPEAARLGAGVAAGARLLYFRTRDGDPSDKAVRVLAAAGRPALVADARQLDGHMAVLVREARLRGAGIVLGPVDALGDKLRDLVARTPDLPTILFGRGYWDPRWGDRTPVSLTVSIEGQHRLGGEQLRRAGTVAEHRALLAGRPVRAEDVQAGVRAQNAAGLERLARRVVPEVGWDDLVLPEPVRRQLTELTIRARHRDQVLGTWRMRPGGGRGRGVTALFAGESGTGKTMACEVVAAELGLDLYVVDLSTVVDKYVGETEKNLERVFDEAVDVQGVLLFDEADAIFGKRSQVKDAHDRYANLESAFLLQRMESFDGIAVLTTNLRANLDEAFTRRLDVIADFPMPDAGQRFALWDRCLGAELPRASDVDIKFCADRFELTGGSIRSCAVTAAYLAADAGRSVTMADLVTAVRGEYVKLGRLVLDSEFSPW
ncbi:ATP-binding protein [Actinocrispum wychmicini]|uniref:ATPase family protein associated with various cellular activities (AAA) n=1 Tax=Actinocrispum wychmicini TaxID=1213861 RepID=A0A4V2S6E5_9PSEU|nr:ATP-binding protein [Actinocrispum wychmicini]TCO55780.1 ATPase family protein associated with various cellular activities (AAA) [Actinocrispum wychmicini]